MNYSVEKQNQMYLHRYTQMLQLSNARIEKKNTFVYVYLLWTILTDAMRLIGSQWNATVKPLESHNTDEIMAVKTPQRYH